MKKRTLNVKQTSREELKKEWGFLGSTLVLPRQLSNNDIYIRCNSKGDVNWDKAPVYSSLELLKRGNVAIINLK